MLLSRKFRINHNHGSNTHQSMIQKVIAVLGHLYFGISFNIQLMKDSSGYVGILLMICYDICIFSHLVISINRMSAIYFPIKYYIHFRYQSALASQSRLKYEIQSFQECGWLRYFDFSQDVTIVTLIAIIDTTSIIKYRLTSIQVKILRLLMCFCNTSECFTVAQGVVFAVELSTYFFFGWLFQNKWAVWSLTTLAWNVVHLSDAIIIITLNKEFRRFLCTILPWNSCKRKRSNLRGFIFQCHCRISSRNNTNERGHKAKRMS
ncbi:unnamed protein product [Haemonchus placei]|uniref:7TM_GPCR_Srx domain-containing protein n=1 Tax=Haemonchus placei TaxID=6290 RepID=A0A0N4WLW4_HAEPC|nr:unnamed protein product [Haemonchus placei]